MNDNFENLQTVTGKDGRPYFTGGARKNVEKKQSKFAKNHVVADDDSEDMAHLMPGYNLGAGSISMLSPKDIQIKKRGTSIENFGLEKNASVYDINSNRQAYSTQNRYHQKTRSNVNEKHMKKQFSN